MIGEGSGTCTTCGTAYITGCVMDGECPSCESKRRSLEGAGWKLKKIGFANLSEAIWEDPKFPGTEYGEEAALKMQEGRDIEDFKRHSK